MPLLAALSAGPAIAADLQVYPIRIVLDPDNPTATLTVSNRGTDDALLQLSVDAWSQVDGEEKLDPTRDILANPGVFLLKGGEQQVARFALRVPQDARERSYRIVVQEVPRTRVEMGLATVLRLLVPVFVPTPNPTVAIDWSVRPGPGGYEVVAHNGGNIHVQIKTVKLAAEHMPPNEKQLNVYVLPGATKLMRVQVAKPAPPGATIILTADSDQGGLSASVRVGTAEGASVRP